MWRDGESERRRDRDHRVSGRKAGSGSTKTGPLNSACGLENSACGLENGACGRKRYLRPVTHVARARAIRTQGTIEVRSNEVTTVSCDWRSSPRPNNIRRSKAVERIIG